jgi:hypothetical protein
MRNSERYASLQSAIDDGIENLKKWYRRMDETDGYVITLGTLRIRVSVPTH